MNEKPKIDIWNILDFNLPITLQFKGKKIVEKIRNKELSPKEINEIKERLVSLILWSIIDHKTNCDEYIIPAMVEGDLISKKEGGELAVLYERKWNGDKKASREFLIKILEYLKKGNGLFIPKLGKRIVERYEYSQESDKRFIEIIKNIRMGP
ncbi:hypothetical protein AC481_00965 [miscellaneous Crenarchaeota group archaeon SMTZ-80]|nr:MAG: hypothetical protein AC481_00965 [miscellaneous Crenarchaeota group archaeon SMTZ-80]